MSKSRATGTREWAKHSDNAMEGCGHNCLYCYARAKDKRADVSWSTETPLPPRSRTGKKTGAIMFPTNHDLTPGNLGVTLPALEALLVAGNDVLVVSKPHLSVIQALCLHLAGHEDRLLFRFTIGSVSDEDLAFWEPGAPTFAERLKALAHARQAGFRTSVSMEPLLSPDEDTILTTVAVLDPHVTDSIWLGKMNHAEERLRANGVWERPGVQERTLALLESQSDERILRLYSALKDNPKVRWKESIKQVVGLDLADETGLDV